MIRISCFGSKEKEWRDLYLKRLTRLFPFEWKDIEIKKQTSERPQSLLPEETSFLKTYSDFILLDSKGKTFTDDAFSRWLFAGPDRHFVIGPSFGFHPDFIEKSTQSISLSSHTLTHSLAQLVFAETLYRAACIQLNHPFAK